MSAIQFLIDSLNRPRTVSLNDPLPVRLMAGVPAGNAGDLPSGADLTVLNANLNSGVATPGSSFEYPLIGASSLTFQVQGVWTGTLLLQGTVDGINWVTVAGLLNVATQAAVNSIASASTGIWQADVSGFAKVRLTCSGAMTGTATVTGITTAAGATIGLDAPLPTGANLIGLVNIRPSAAEGASNLHKLISAATTNATSVKASAGTVNLIVVCNLNAAARFLKLYNKASAPTVGTDTPVLVIAIPANQTVVIPGELGVRFSTGIAYALTTGIADADTGAVAAAEHAVNINYT